MDKYEDAYYTIGKNLKSDIEKKWIDLLITRFNEDSVFKELVIKLFKEERKESGLCSSIEDAAKLARISAHNKFISKRIGMIK